MAIVEVNLFVKCTAKTGGACVSIRAKDSATRWTRRSSSGELRQLTVMQHIKEALGTDRLEQGHQAVICTEHIVVCSVKHLLRKWGFYIS